MRVAIVHEWLINIRGSEKVLIEFAKLFPEAVIYVSVLDRDILPDMLKDREIRTTFIQNLPFSKKMYQKYLPLMPLAYESLDLTSFDLIISSSHACAKGIIPSPHAFHISYCYTPMRYAWSGFQEYRKTLKNKPMQWLMTWLMHKMRKWDVSTCARVDQFVAISSEVQRRIKKYYRRDSVIIFPPVHIEESIENREELISSRVKNILRELDGKPYFLCLGRVVPYKRIDLAVDAANFLGIQLVVAGNGSELDFLKKRAGPTVRFVESFTDEDASALYRFSQAFIFPGEEDFGITVVEAQSYGKPIIAFARGGIEDTVIPGVTGVLFYEQTVEALAEVIANLNKYSFNSYKIIENAQRFSGEYFAKKINDLIMEITNMEVSQGNE